MHIFTFDSYHRSALGAATVVLALSSALFAAPLSADDEIPVDSKPENIIEEVVVRAHPLSGEGLAQGSVSLADNDLARNLAANLGDVLDKQAFTLPALVLRLAAQSFRDWEALEFR